MRKRFAPPSRAIHDTVLAAHFHGAVDAAGFPLPKAWESAKPIHFDTDWQGKNPDPHRQTQVRLLWTPQFLHLKFV
ncbi:MAG TPA: hypothetical protein VII37_10865, partial [Candidatus Acidoferrum sp.]